MRRRLLEQGAYLWLAARGRFKRAQVWIFLFLVGAWWTWAWIKTGTTFTGEALNPINLTSAIIVNSVATISRSNAARRHRFRPAIPGLFVKLR